MIPFEAMVLYGLALSYCVPAAAWLVTAWWARRCRTKPGRVARQSAYMARGRL